MGNITIVEVIVEKEVPSKTPVSVDEVLASCTPGMLLGRAFDKILPALSPNQAAAAVALAETIPTIQRAVYVPPVTPAPTPAAKQQRILCVGVFPDTIRFVKEKCATLSNIDVSFVDSDTHKVPKVQCDFVILMRRIVSHSLAAQVRSFIHHNRIIYVEGGQNELMQKLADLNSRQPTA